MTESAKLPEPWFDDARIIDQHWVEIVIRDDSGAEMRFRIPRKTQFETVDRVAAEHGAV